MGYLDKSGLTWLWGKILAKLSGKSDVGHSHSYTEITGKPATFTPASHTHDAGNITSGVLPVARGGTGATTAAAALTKLGAAAKPKAVTVTLTTAGWKNNVQTVVVSGVLADSAKQAILASPAPASWKDAGEAMVYCSGQAANSLTFTCDSTPTVNLSYQVLIQEAQA